MCFKNKMIKYLCLIQIIFVFVNSGKCEEHNFKVVNIESGPIRGVQRETIFEKTPFYSFQGIPYVKPPLGELRFELPQKPDPWTQIKDTLKTGLDCLQVRDAFGEGKNTKSGEDCIYMNVYTPDISTSQKLAVMVYIHGGGFQEGSSSETFLGPDFLMDENVVLVTFNYRLGPFGFISLDSHEIPKNLGLKDQQYALKWVNKNIHLFGGDNSSVTIFGQSAGGASVHFHSLSTESRQYFQRAILHSGAASITLSYVQKGYNHEKAMFKFAEGMGSNLTSITELITFLKAVDAKTLFEMTKSHILKVENGRKLIELPYCPVVEDENADNPFFTERPEKLMKTSGIDMMIGHTTQEDITFPETKDPSLLAPFLERFDMNFPRNDFIFEYDTEIYQNMSRKVKDFYFPRGNIIDTESALQLVDLFSDHSFSYPLHVVANNNFNNNFQTFFYVFGVTDRLNVAKILANVTIGGAGHGDELCYLFKCGELGSAYNDIKEDSIAYKTIKLMTKLWSNFAKYGNPTKDYEVQWKLFTEIDQNKLYVMNEGVSLESKNSTLARTINRRVQFWIDIFEEYKSFAKNLD